MNNIYIDNKREHVTAVQLEIEALHDIIQTRPLSVFEYRALERTLQIMVEACIGIGKHLCKEKTKLAPADAYQAFERLNDHKINMVDDVNWRQVIGLRNALVHDYLNIDRVIVEHILKKELYKGLVNFSQNGLDLLTEP